MITFRFLAIMREVKLLTEYSGEFFSQLVR